MVPYGRQGLGTSPSPRCSDPGLLRPSSALHLRLLPFRSQTQRTGAVRTVAKAGRSSRTHKIDEGSNALQSTLQVYPIALQNCYLQEACIAGGIRRGWFEERLFTPKATVFPRHIGDKYFNELPYVQQCPLYSAACKFKYSKPIASHDWNTHQQSYALSYTVGSH